MGNETQRSKDIARAAQLREAILGALRASVAPMTVAELTGMSGVVSLYHKQLLPQKVGAQVASLVKSNHVTKVARGQYAINRVKDAPVPARNGAQPVQHLQLEVSKKDKTVSFTFEGLQITVKVLP